MKKRLFTIFLAFLFMISGLFPPQSSAAGAGQDDEFRAFWVDAFHDGFKTEDQVDQLIEDVEAANANAVIVQVRRRGDAYFNKALEPRTQDPSLQEGYDVLEDLIDKAHAKGIEVHAWLATLPIWNSITPPTSPDHVFNTNGPSAEGEDFWLMTNSTGAMRSGADYVLDPGHPDALDYTVDQYVNVVKQYDVDGIHLDLARYMGTDWGYNPTSIERYQDVYKTDQIPEPNDPSWAEWRREQINSLVRKVYLKAIAVNPHVKVSCATIAWGAGPKTQEEYENTRTMTEVFQDWQGWLRDEIIDIAIPMNYDREHVESQRQWYDEWIAFQKANQFNRHIAAGPAAYLNSIESTLAQTRRALAPDEDGRKLAGVSYYSYAVTDMNNQPRSPFIDALVNGTENEAAVFPEKADVPEMKWKTRPKSGYLMGQARTIKKQDIADSTLEIKGAKGFKKTIQTDGNGWFGLSGLKPGAYVIKISDGQYKSPAYPVIIKPGKVKTITLIGR